MKFGLHLSQHIYLPWKHQYINYDELKYFLKDRQLTGGGWTFEDEIYFNKQLIDKQFEKVNCFIETKINHLSLEEVRPLLDFIHLNTIGFKKILKKHDKWTEFTLAHKYNRYWDNYITIQVFKSIWTF
ncbi:uncharacterized protein RHIMIDRAFT_276042 [Rhizopus microsporus ATCC 52813]|uniref:SPX domain-containing protein n=1 Tax=Rhizopus microsporus ATCC 52813 TaxID=1340429 RepID=A0A2G4T128_RHIZD|nr:uncharacterized protein RHIMIDRAFT_276042 [Rhizopus microsporus ATCC 52813]PHZ14730.1 hypothetical protein RHIMIDRAFT_276042 [Rhizopus microsporus ATCC 52813]